MPTFSQQVYRATTMWRSNVVRPHRQADNEGYKAVQSRQFGGTYSAGFVRAARRIAAQEGTAKLSCLTTTPGAR